jgi:putative glutamine amidotransferase
VLSFVKKWKRRVEFQLIIPEGRNHISKLDLLVLGGGTTPSHDCGRDKFEYRVLEKAIDSNVSVVGICRGSQLLVNYFGGELVPVRGHINSVRNLDGAVNRLGRCFHEMAIGKLPSNFKSIARDLEDKSTEIFFDSERQLLGLMSHPERMEKLPQQFLKLCKIINWS